MFTYDVIDTTDKRYINLGTSNNLVECMDTVNLNSYPEKDVKLYFNSEDFVCDVYILDELSFKFVGYRED